MKPIVSIIGLGKLGASMMGCFSSKNIEKIGLIINRIRPNMVKTDDMMSIEDVKNTLGIDLVGVIPDREKIIICINKA